MSHYAQMADTHCCYGAYLQRRRFRGCRAKRLYAHGPYNAQNPPLSARFQGPEGNLIANSP